MRIQRCFYQCTLIIGTLIILSGCVSKSWSKSGEKEYWNNWMKSHSVAVEGLDVTKSGEKFENLVDIWLKEQIGELTKIDALKLFPEPTRRRKTEIAESVGWHFVKGTNLDWDLFVITGNKSQSFDFFLVLGFDNDDLLRSFEISFARNPSFSIGGTTKHIAEAGVAFASAWVLSQMMEKTLNAASDHFVNKLRGLSPDLKEAISGGIRKGLPSDFTTKGGKITGTFDGKPIEIDIPGTGFEIK